MDCLFCKIIAGEIPSTKVYEDEFVYAFKDINPIAPVHVLFIPKQHISGASAVNAENAEVVGKIFTAIAKVAAQEKLDSGFRRRFGGRGRAGRQHKQQRCGQDAISHKLIWRAG